MTTTPHRTAETAALPRAEGAARLSVKLGPHGRTALDDLWRRGAAKFLFPANYDDAALEASFINSAGGLTGGDVLTLDLSVATGTCLRVTTPGAEKVWRALPEHPPARMTVRAAVAPGATLEWLPQETILFDQAALDRRLTIDLSGDAAATLVEATVLGRQAMGETPQALRFSDHVALNRDGAPLLWETARLDGPLESLLNHRAALAGARAFGVIARAAPDAEAWLDPVRAVLAQHDAPALRAAASAWNGVLVVRFLAPDGATLRRGLSPVLACLRGRPAPRAWTI